MASHTRPPFNPGYAPNGEKHQPAPLLPNQGRIVHAGPFRILCIADVRGNLQSLNELATRARADYIIHTGDFGFYDDTSLDRIAEKTLKHVAQYSPLIPDHIKKSIAQGGSGTVKSRFPAHELPLSQLHLLLSGSLKLDVPIYTVWGACEDVRVLEKFRSKEYKVPNLYIIDEAQSMLLETGGVKLRLLGLGGAVVMHKLFDNGEGRTTIAGGQGTMWTTLLQMGELIDTANRVYDPTETRVFVTHASPAREGILNQLSVVLKADFSISAGLHFRYGSSYNEFSVNPSLDHYRGKLAASKASFNDVWETVKAEVEPAIQQNETQQSLLKNALGIVDKMPSTASGGSPFGGGAAAGPGSGQVDESAFKNMWNFNLADAAFGWLVLEIEDGRIGTEMRAQGFNFSHRGSKQASSATQASVQAVGQAITTTNSTALSSLPAEAPPLRPPSAVATPVPAVPQRQPSSQVLAQSVAPARVATAQPKPSTPQYVTAAPATTSKEGERAPVTNGNTANGLDAASPLMTKSLNDIVGLYVINSQHATDDQIREPFAGEDRARIEKIEARGQAKVVFFRTIDERDGALSRLPDELKNQARGSDDRSKLNFRIYSLPSERGRYGGSRGGGASWGGGRHGSGRGNDRDGPGGGFRNAGGGPTSDSDSNRRGRSGRGRNSERGGRTRGPRGGGGMKGDGGNGSPAPAAATPADL